MLSRASASLFAACGPQNADNCLTPSPSSSLLQPARSALASRLNSASGRRSPAFFVTTGLRSRVILASCSLRQPGPPEDANSDSSPHPPAAQPSTPPDVPGGTARARSTHLGGTGLGDGPLSGPDAVPAPHQSSSNSGIGGSGGSSGSSGRPVDNSSTGSSGSAAGSEASSSTPTSASPDSGPQTMSSTGSGAEGSSVAGGSPHQAVPPAAAAGRPYLNGHAGPSAMAPGGEADGAAADDRPGVGPSSLPPLRLDFLDLWAKMQMPPQVREGQGRRGSRVPGGWWR